VFSQIKNDHKKILALFRKVAKTSEKSARTREKLFAQLRESIVRHSRAEEETIYPLLSTKPATRAAVLKNVGEHEVVEYLLEKMDHTDVARWDWVATFEVLRDAITNHIEKEEAVLLPKMKRALSRVELGSLTIDFADSHESVLEAVEKVMGLQ